MIKTRHFGYVFVLPFFLTVVVFQAYPIIDTFLTSFTNDSLSALDAVPMFVGWDNYVRELSSELLSTAFANTLVMTGSAMVLQFLFALTLSAFLTSRDLKIRGKNVWLVFFFLPSQISVALLSLNLLEFFYPNGGILTMLLHGGNPAESQALMDSEFSSWFFIVASNLFLSFGITTYFLVNSIRSIPKAVFEAATIDGASSRQVFWRISLPSLQPILIFLVAVSLVLDLTMFDLPYALFPGSGGGAGLYTLGFEGGVGQKGVTLGTYAYERTFVWDSDLGAGASVVMIMFVLIAALSLVYFRLMKRTQEEFSVVS